jgi:ATP-binding cassette subfamily B protein
MLPTVATYSGNTLTRGTRLRMQGALFRAVNLIPGIRAFEDPVVLDRIRLAQDSGETAPSQALQSMMGIVQAGVTLIGFMVSLVVVAPVLAALIVIGGLPELVTQVSINRLRVRNQLLGVRHSRRRLFYGMLHVQEPAAREVRLFGFGQYIQEKMQDELAELNRLERAVDLKQMRLGAVSGLSTSLIGAAGLVLTVLWVADGHLSIGDVALYLAALVGTQGSLSGIMQSIGLTVLASGAFRQYEAVMGAPPDIHLEANPRRITALGIGLEFRDVWFRYEGSPSFVLTGLDFTIRAGTSVALVGLNGAGKTTIAKLLCRFYDPTRGAILWDGVDLREFDVVELRARMTASFQDCMEYDLTLRENIAVGRIAMLHSTPSISMASNAAGLGEIVDGLPSGYETMLGRTFSAEEGVDAGVRLSGGEWQRVAMARAFMRADADLAVLDEPSGSLDALAEQRLFSLLRDQMGGRTTLLITHRMSTARAADMIVTLDKGRVCESGGHEELMASHGLYFRLFQSQAKGFGPQHRTRPEARVTAGGEVLR